MLPCPDVAEYRIAEAGDLLTPALAIYPDILDQNMAAMLKLVGVERWRPHIKTSKLGFTIRRLVERGLVNLKCATSLELHTACEAGAQDVVVAYPVMGGGVVRVREVAARFPQVRLSVLVENAAQVAPWRGSRVGLFLDINPGMDRTGIRADRVDDIIAIVRHVAHAGLEFRGLHWYEGHLHEPDLAQRTTAAHRGYDRLMNIVEALEGEGIGIEEVITSGTPAFPCALSYEGFRNHGFVHRVSPGTVVYNDCTSLTQLPADYGLKPAALVVATVVSQPTEHIVTCDAGHKTVSADAGIPNCSVAGWPGLVPLKPSEEHLPLEVAQGAAPQVGDLLYLVPRHVCPTVNNYDHALIVRHSRIVGVEDVTARGREVPLRAETSARA